MVPEATPPMETAEVTHALGLPHLAAPLIRAGLTSCRHIAQQHKDVARALSGVVRDMCARAYQLLCQV